MQDDANFLVETTDWQGKKAVKKTAKPSAPLTRIERVNNDVLGMQFFAELADKHPTLQLWVPIVYESGPGYYIREFIKDEPVVNEDTPFEHAKPRLDHLAELLAEIDGLDLPAEPAGYIGSSNYQNLANSIPRWADENIADGIMTKEEGARAKEISIGLGKYLEPRIAHGDMSPYKHAYLSKDGKIALIDFENFTTHAARYFDVAWSYTRLYGFADSPDHAKYFLSSFMKKANMAPHMKEQLMAVILQRTLGLQKDADADLKETGIDRKARAKHLLGFVLENTLGLLHL